MNYARKLKKLISLSVAAIMLLATVFGYMIAFDKPIVAYAAALKVWNGKIDTSWYTGDMDFYKISTAEQLAGLAKLVNDGNDMSGITFVLTKDIILNKTSNFSKWDKKGPKNKWTMIGSKDHTFRGIFDGQGHSVTGLYIKDTKMHGMLYPSAADGGLFGYTVEASIANLKIKNAYINTLGVNGAVASRAQNSYFYGIEVTNSVFKNGSAGGIVGASAYDYTGLFLNYATYISMAAMGAGFNPLLFGDSLMLPDDFTGTIFYGCKVKGVKFKDNNIAAGICALGGEKDTGIGAKACLVMNTTMKTDGTKGGVLGVKPSKYAILKNCYKTNIKVDKKSKNKSLIDKKKVKNITLSSLKKTGAKKLGKPFESVKGKEPKLKSFERTADKMADASVYKLIKNGDYYISQGESYLAFEGKKNAITSSKATKFKFTYKKGGFYTIQTSDGAYVSCVDGKLEKQKTTYNSHRFTQRWELVKRGDSYYIQKKGSKDVISNFTGFMFFGAKGITVEPPEELGGDNQIGYSCVWEITAVK